MDVSGGAEAQNPGIQHTYTININNIILLKALNLQNKISYIMRL